MREGMSLYEGVRRLGFMVGIQSNNRNLKTEDDAYARAMAVGDLITPEVAAVTKPGDDVEAMAARDITINHNYPTPMQPATPAVTPAPTMSLAKKAAIAAALVGGGAAAPLLYQYFNQQPTPVVEPIDPATPDFNLLPPDPAPGDTK